MPPSYHTLHSLLSSLTTFQHVHHRLRLFLPMIPMFYNCFFPSPHLDGVVGLRNDNVGSNVRDGGGYRMFPILVDVCYYDDDYQDYIM